MFEILMLIAFCFPILMTFKKPAPQPMAVYVTKKEVK